MRRAVSRLFRTLAHGGSFGLSCVLSVICRARPLWPSASPDGKLVTLQWRTGTRAAPCKRIGMYTEGPSVFRVLYRPFAGRGPCGRPHPRWEIGYPAMADGHKGRTLQLRCNFQFPITISLHQTQDWFCAPIHVTGKSIAPFFFFLLPPFSFFFLFSFFFFLTPFLFSSFSYFLPSSFSFSSSSFLCGIFAPLASLRANHHSLAVITPLSLWRGVGGEAAWGLGCLV